MEEYGMRDFRPSQSDKNIWHVLWGAAERRQRRAVKEEEGKKWSCRIELSVVRKVAFYEGYQRWKAGHAGKLLPKVAKLTLNINKNVAKGSCR